MDAPGCYERAARAEKKFRTTRLGIGQNCRAVCTKKSGLNASGNRALALELALSNNRRESVTF